MGRLPGKRDLGLRLFAPRNGAEALRPADFPFPARSNGRARPRATLHFRRIELKYFVPYRMVDYVVERLSPWTEVDPHLVKEGRGRTSYPVTSLYFDTYDLQAFSEKEAGQFFRRKIRLRTYEPEFSETEPCFLEIKRRLDSVVVKDRLSFPGGALRAAVPVNRLLEHLLAQDGPRDRTFVEVEVMRGWLSLQATALVRYGRLALVAKEDAKLRVTVDHNLEGLWRPAHILGPIPYRSIDNINASGMDGISGKYAILELKCNRAVPGWFHRLVLDLELCRTAYSKYFLVVAALRPRLLADCHLDFAPTRRT